MSQSSPTSSPPVTCDASTLGAFDRPLGPCVLRHGHDGPVHRGPAGETWWLTVAVAEAPPTAAGTPDADAEQLARWARREALLVLVTRVQHGRTLTDDEARTLREHVETEMREAEAARATIERMKRTNRMVNGGARESRERAARAAAAVERVRAVRDGITELARGADGGAADAFGVVLHRLTAALDGTEEPTTEEQGQQPGCSCHNGDELCSGCRRCPDICNGCDGPEQLTTEASRQ
jgi:hypothetical protein